MPNATRRFHADRLRLPFLLLSLAGGTAHTATNYAFEQHVHAIGQGSRFGDALALSGETLVAVDSDANGNDAYLFVRGSGTWLLQQAIDLPGWTPQPTITANAHARGRVALSGDTLAVGSPGDNIGGLADVGSVRIYQRSGAIWSLQQRIDRPAAPSVTGNFGASVAIEGDRLVVGAPGRTAYGRGAVYHYVRTGSSWSLASSISPPAELGRSFGQAVALAGDRLVVGIPDVRRAMAYRRVGADWQNEAIFSPTSTDPTIAFGGAVAVTGDYAFVSAPTGQAPDGRAVHVYYRSGGNWGLTQRLGPVGANRFGAGLAVLGTRLAVADPDQLDPVTQRRGRVHVYEQNGLFWVEQQTLRYPESPSSALADFGTRLAIDAQELLAFSALAAPGAAGDDGQVVAYRQAAASLQLGSPLAFGAVAVGSTSAARDLSVGNSGNSPLTINAIQAATAPFVRVGGGSCGNLLPIVVQPGASCTLRYTFSPAGVGAAGQTIAFTSNDPSGPKTASLSGSGVVAQLTITPGDLFVGSTVVGVPTSPAVLTLSNASAAALTVQSIGSPAAPFSSVAGGTCLAPPFALAPGQSCTHRYVYAPTTSGFHSTLFTISSTASNSPHSVSLSGFADGPGLALSNGTSLDFGSVAVATPSATLTQTLTSTGVTDALVQSIDVPAGPFERVGGDCPAPPFALPPDVACTLVYRFTPEALGPAVAIIGVSSNTTPTVAAFELTGTGALPALVIGNHPLDLGGVPIGEQTPVKSAILENVGNLALTIQSIGSAGAPFALVGGSCSAPPFDLAPGASCTLDYRFAPAVLGDASQQLTLISNAPGSPHSLTLLGKGTLSSLSLTPSLQDFGPLAVGQSANAMVTLSSAGNTALTIQALGVPAAPFGLGSDSCPPVPFVLDAGQSCSLQATFAPAAKGLFEDSITVMHAGDNGPAAIVLRGRGAPAAPSLSPAIVNFGIAGVGEPGLQQTVTLSNVSPVSLVLGTLVLSGGIDYSLQSDQCSGQTLAAGATCQFVLRFAPAMAGNTADLLSIPSDAVGSPAVLIMQGIGVVPSIFANGFE